MQITSSLELVVTLFFQSLGPWLEAPMQALSFLGREEFFMLVIPTLYWCVDAALGLRVGIMLVLGSSLNCYLKIIFHTPRPYWVSPQVKALSAESSFGLPSGHAENAASIWGLLASSVRKPWLTGALIVGIVGIGVSRIYLGVHFTSDVLLGWILGALSVWAFVRLEPGVMKWLSKRSSAQIAGFGLASSLGLILLNYLSLLTLGDWKIPTEWIAGGNLTPDFDPLSITGILTNAGIWVGLVWGALWLENRGGLDASGSGLQRFARFLLGAVGLAILYLGLGRIFPRNADLLSYSLRYLRYALIGVWVTAGAPMLFIRLGLAHKKTTIAAPETGQYEPALKA